MRYKFTASRIVLVGYVNSWSCTMDVYIDEVLKANIDNYKASPYEQKKDFRFESDYLEYSEHEIKIVNIQNSRRDLGIHGFYLLDNGGVGVAEVKDISTSVEKGKNATVSLVRKGGSVGQLTITVKTNEITAIKNLYYIDCPETSLTFENGETTKDFIIETVYVNNDALGEVNFSLQIASSTTNFGVGDNETCTITLIDCSQPISGYFFSKYGDLGLIKSGGWTDETNGTFTSRGSIDFSFTGCIATIIGYKNSWSSTATISIDGGSSIEFSVAQATESQNEIQYTSGLMIDGRHTITISSTDDYGFRGLRYYVLPPTSTFTFSSYFSASKSFASSTNFIQTNKFEDSKQFSFSHRFNPSKILSLSNQFKETSVFNPTNHLSKSNNFKSTSNFINSKYYSDSNQFLLSSKLNPSKGFSVSKQFDETLELSPSKYQTKSERFSTTYNFMVTSDFSVSKQLLSSASFIHSIVFSISDDFIITSKFSQTKQLTESSQFRSSTSFSLTGKFTFSQKFPISGEFSQTMNFLFSNEFSKSEKRIESEDINLQTSTNFESNLISYSRTSSQEKASEFHEIPDKSSEKIEKKDFYSSTNINQEITDTSTIINENINDSSFFNNNIHFDSSITGIHSFYSSENLNFEAIDSSHSNKESIIDNTIESDVLSSNNMVQVDSSKISEFESKYSIESKYYLMKSSLDKLDSSDKDEQESSVSSIESKIGSDEASITKTQNIIHVYSSETDVNDLTDSSINKQQQHEESFEINEKSHLDSSISSISHLETSNYQANSFDSSEQETDSLVIDNQETQNKESLTGSSAIDNQETENKQSQTDSSIIDNQETEKTISTENKQQLTDSSVFNNNVDNSIINNQETVESSVRDIQEAQVSSEASRSDIYNLLTTRYNEIDKSLVGSINHEESFTQTLNKIIVSLIDEASSSSYISETQLNHLIPSSIKNDFQEDFSSYEQITEHSSLFDPGMNHKTYHSIDSSLNYGKETAHKSESIHQSFEISNQIVTYKITVTGSLSRNTNDQKTSMLKESVEKDSSNHLKYSSHIELENSITKSYQKTEDSIEFNSSEAAIEVGKESENNEGIDGGKPSAGLIAGIVIAVIVVVALVVGIIVYFIMNKKNNYSSSSMFALDESITNDDNTSTIDFPMNATLGSISTDDLLVNEDMKDDSYGYEYEEIEVLENTLIQDE